MANTELIESATIFYCNELDIQPELEVYIDDSKDLKVNGLCYHNDGEFLILINGNLEDGHALVTLAHELVHVKQYMKNDLEEKLDLTIPYHDRWWEKEAFEMESVLASRLLNAINQKEFSYA